MFTPPIVTASALGAQACAPAGVARHLAHVALDLLALELGLGLGVAAVEPGDDALVGGVGSCAGGRSGCGR